MPLDPAAPAPDLRRSLAALRPTSLIDGDGRHPLRGGVPVPADVSAIVATSGTTAERKGVELTGEGLAASANAVASRSADPTGGRWLCCLPLHHVAGLAVVGRAWVNGLPVTVHPGFDAMAVAEAGRAGADSVSMVPTMLQRLLDHDARAVARFGHILLGGGPIDPGLLERARAAGARVSTTYGMTETWGGIVHDGHPLPGVELRLDAAAGPGDVGEIFVRGPMLMRGYRLWPEGTAAAIDADGWYRTGDLGRLDRAAGDRLWVLDRTGDVVNTGGVKVSPTEVERVLAAHPSVADVCIAGRPDPEWGERVVAFVVPAVATDPPPLADLRAFAGRHLPAAKLPRQLVILPAIPRTAGGKPLRRLLPGEEPDSSGTVRFRP
jgi:O-succinylbenzoic acid--CoA ligase